VSARARAWALLMAAPAAMAACHGHIGEGGDRPAPPAASPESTGVCAQSDNDEIRLLLEPTCAGCHGATSNKPFFASLQAFEGLLVADPTYVVPGKPDESLLVRVLEGNGPGLYKQMPPSGATFAALAEEGNTGIDMTRVREWVTHLDEIPLDPDPDPSAVHTRRLTAEEVVVTLMSQIGLDPAADFVAGHGSFYESPTVSLKGKLPVYSPDAAPPVHSPGKEDDRFLALGGPDWMNQRPRTQDFSASFLQTLTQVSQAWCQMAVQKADNSVFFAKASRSDTSAAAGQAIRDNIAWLHLRMLGEPASNEEIDRIYDGLFVRYEPEGTDVAWTAVCAAFVRHPLWLSF
jgi:hypothetical protein